MHSWQVCTGCRPETGGRWLIPRQISLTEDAKLDAQAVVLAAKQALSARHGPSLNIVGTHIQMRVSRNPSAGGALKPSLDGHSSVLLERDLPLPPLGEGWDGGLSAAMPFERHAARLRRLWTARCAIQALDLVKNGRMNQPEQP